MTVAQSIRHSKTSQEVVNEKIGSDHNDTCRMLGREEKQNPDEEDESQKPRVKKASTRRGMLAANKPASLCPLCFSGFNTENAEDLSDFCG